MKYLKKLIKKYFQDGLQQDEILAFLRINHKIHISHRTLKRVLSSLHLYRRKYYTNIQNVINFLEKELSGSGKMAGYRWMHLKCIQNGIVVKQEVVRELLNYLDPRGVKLRKRKRLRRRQYSNKGPNFLWHMDSYDKLKPYGICINGCIDGFSRYIVWLRAGRTASDPKVIAGYYLSAIEELGGYPKTIRADMGTENRTTEKIQLALKELFGNDSRRPSFLYGKSTANQRIECWWCILRKNNAQFWINLFETLKDDGLFNGSFLDKSLIQFCFLEIIQDELDKVVYEWNLHKIRGSRNSISPTGRPIVMFQLPNLYRRKNFLMEMPPMVIEFLAEECTYYHEPCDTDVLNLCNYIMIESEMAKNKNCYDAVELYVRLRIEIYSLLSIRLP